MPDKDSPSDPDKAAPAPKKHVMTRAELKAKQALRSGGGLTPMTWMYVVLVGAIGALLLFQWVESPADPSPGDDVANPGGPVERPADSSPGHDVAVADTGDPAPPDAVVARYAVALAALEGSCVADPNTSHADYAIRAKQLAADEGHTITALILLESMVEAADSLRGTGVPCSDAYATLLTLILSDQ
jgi:hypothetical protein